MSSDVLTREREQRYAAAFPGWKRSMVPRCPRVVAGRRCYRGDGRNVPECICVRFSRIFDHTRAWRTPEGFRVLTTEPYNVDLDDLAAFRQECRDLGLTAATFTASPYNPGGTVTVMISRSDQVARHRLRSRPYPPSGGQILSRTAPRPGGRLRAYKMEFSE